MDSLLMVHGIDELVTNPSFADYQLRVTDPKLCDTSVKQHSGYLDVSDGKHLFFWCVLKRVGIYRLAAYHHTPGSSNRGDRQRKHPSRFG